MTFGIFKRAEFVLRDRDRGTLLYRFWRDEADERCGSALFRIYLRDWSAEPTLYPAERQTADHFCLTLVPKIRKVFEATGDPPEVVMWIR